MKKTLLIAGLALTLSACVEMGAVLDAMMAPPTDREACESELVGGKWIDGQCLTEATCDGVIKDGICYRKALEITQ